MAAGNRQLDDPGHPRGGPDGPAAAGPDAPGTSVAAGVPAATGDPGPDGYDRLIRQLAETTAWVRAQRAEADAWYAQQRASAERAVRAAAEAVHRAEAEVAAAREEVDRVEAEVAHLWQALRDRFGWATRRFGDPPVPAQGASPADPDALLESVRAVLDRARRPGELPSSTQPLLALFGALGAAAAYGLGLAARATGARYGGDLAVAMPVLALVVTLLGPVIGLAPARLLADRRHAGLDTRAVAAVLIAGVVTTAALFALAR